MHRRNRRSNGRLLRAHLVLRCTFNRRVAALQREIVSLETDERDLVAECGRAPSLPTDDLPAELRRSILDVSTGQALK